MKKENSEVIIPEGISQDDKNKAESADMIVSNMKRLPKTVIPEHYDLSINVKQDSFNGTVKIQLEAEIPVDSFYFNSKDLELSELKVTENNVLINNRFQEEQEDFFKVYLDKKVSGKFELSVKYSGKYSKSMAGFYKSKYNENDLFSTHFESSDARRAFPCFDQPNLKSTFSITIEAPEGNIALSNAELEKQVGNTYIFKKTPKMSTYIVAYVVGKLDYIEDTSYIPIRVYAHPEEKQWGKFSLDVATRCLKFFGEYFETPYPLTKLDMVAIPSFAMGAMENWGLVTYRKTSLLFDETSTSIRSKKNIAVTVCHELAHMWFGNLVTMDWWSDLWLNEGFATWAATLAIDKSIQDMMPWDAWTSFISDDIESGMGMDSIKSTHKIGIEVNDPIDIDQIFDAISYSKGSSVIKMLENWLGPEVFRKGLVGYIKKFSYDNTITSDLWDSLSKAAQENELDAEVATVIDPWVQRPGFPYVEVKDSGDKLTLIQKRFTIGHKVEESEPWSIPIRILWLDDNKEVDSTTARESKVYLMSEEVMEIKKEGAIYKLNDNVSGLYRVLYPESNLKKLFEQDLNTNNRLNLFADIFAMAKAFHVPLQQPLSYLTYLSDESNYEVLSSVLGNLLFFSSIFYDDQAKLDYFTQKTFDIVKDRFISIDLKEVPDDINKTALYSMIVSRAVSAGLPEAIEKFEKIELNDINPEYMRPFFISKIGTDFEKTFDLYKNSQKPGEKQHALFALGTSNVESDIDVLFDRIEEIEPHDSIYLFASLSSNLKHRNKIATLAIDNFDRIKEHIGNSGITRHLVEFLFGHVLQDEYNAKVTNFLSDLMKDKEMKSAIDKCNDALSLAKEIRSRHAEVNFD
ncbi:hypothetical protein GINT2_001513 [Glugoides intestinalis]